jgi:hypothetical protein
LIIVNQQCHTAVFYQISAENHLHHNLIHKAEALELVVCKEITAILSRLQFHTTRQEQLPTPLLLLLHLHLSAFPCSDVDDPPALQTL